MGRINSTGINWRSGSEEEKIKMREYQKSYRTKNQVKVRQAARDSAYKLKYGITLEDYNRMLNNQNGCCAICDRHSSVFEKNLYLDHDHKSGQVRGLLCLDCNTSLGRFHDDTELLLRAIDYLRKDHALYIA